MFSVSVINPSAGLADSFAEPVTAATLAPNREFDLAPRSILDSQTSPGSTT